MAIINGFQGNFLSTKRLKKFKIFDVGQRLLLHLLSLIPIPFTIQNFTVLDFTCCVGL